MTNFYKKYKKSVDARYKTVQKLMNMTLKEAIEWKKNICSKAASIKRLEVLNRAIRIKRKPKEDWVRKDYNDAGKIISYISRASKIEEGRSANKNCPRGKNFYALKNWLHDPSKRRKKKNKMATKKKTAKRKTTKKKTAKRRTVKRRNVTKKKTAKRKTAKRKTAKRKTAKRKTAKRKTAKRKTAKRKTAKRKTAKRKTAKRRTIKRR